jgi:hypothetical protein
MTQLVASSIWVNVFVCNQSVLPPKYHLIGCLFQRTATGGILLGFYGYVLCFVSLISDYLAVINPKTESAPICRYRMQIHPSK